MNKLKRLFQNKCYSIGHISNSILWISIEFKPSYYRGFSPGKTYNGTICGLIAWTKRITVIAHIRNLRAVL